MSVQARRSAAGASGTAAGQSWLCRKGDAPPARERERGIADAATARPRAPKWFGGLQKVFETEGGFDKMVAARDKAGYANHFFLPESGDDKPMMCLWEGKPGSTAEAFQPLIDGSEFISVDGSPVSGAIKNTVFPVMPGGMLPPSAFGGEKAGPPKPSTGAWFFVKHNLKEGKGDDFWAWMGALDMKAYTEKANAAGFANPCFCPTAKEGPLFCIWETKADMSAEEFTKFIDGPDGPAPGTMENVVHKVNKEAAGPFLPSATFV